MENITTLEIVQNGEYSEVSSYTYPPYYPLSFCGPAYIHDLTGLEVFVNLETLEPHYTLAQNLFWSF